MGKRALITGITGQDGSYLAEFLLEKGYEVHGIARRVAIENPAQRLGRISHLLDEINLHAGSLESFPSLYHTMARVEPDEIYHLAAQSFVGYSFEDEFSTMGVNVNGTHYMLAATRELVPHARFYFAGSSEMFGKAQAPQSESTPFWPRSTYGVSKVAGCQLARNYREAWGLFACCGILYNHESPRRGLEFVTRKITSQVARIKLGLDDKLRLGNLEARRDWGHAREYVRAMWLMLQEDQPDDYVIATGETHSVREVVESAFRLVDLDPWCHVELDANLVRPAEVDLLQGDATKARHRLGWTNLIGFEELVSEMVEADLSMLRRAAAVACA